MRYHHEATAGRRLSTVSVGQRDEAHFVPPRNLGR